MGRGEPWDDHNNNNRDIAYGCNIIGQTDSLQCPNQESRECNSCTVEQFQIMAFSKYIWFGYISTYNIHRMISYSINENDDCSKCSENRTPIDVNISLDMHLFGLYLVQMEGYHSHAIIAPTIDPLPYCSASITTCAGIMSWTNLAWSDPSLKSHIHVCGLCPCLFLYN